MDAIGFRFWVQQRGVAVAVMLVVTDGVPEDLGKSLNLTDLPGATLGRGVGSNLRLADPAWHGRVRVDRVAGVYRVTNEMGHTISLGEENLPDGAAGTWYNGVELQATADTCFALQTDKDVILLDDDGEPAWRKAGTVGIILLALVVVPAVVFLDQPNASERATTPAGIRRDFDKLSEQLRDLDQGPLAPTATAALAELQAARLAELSNRPQEAIDHYDAARILLEKGLATARAGREPPEDEVRLLERVREFIGDRLIPLSQQVKRRRR